MPEPRHFLLRIKAVGGHVHVGVWAGTANQAAQQSRPKLGDLVMDQADWFALVGLLADGSRSEHSLTIEGDDA